MRFATPTLASSLVLLAFLLSPSLLAPSGLVHADAPAATAAPATYATDAPHPAEAAAAAVPKANETTAGKHEGKHEGKNEGKHESKQETKDEKHGKIDVGNGVKLDANVGTKIKQDAAGEKLIHAAQKAVKGDSTTSPAKVAMKALDATPVSKELTKPLGHTVREIKKDIKQVSKKIRTRYAAYAKVLKAHDTYVQNNVHKWTKCRTELVAKRQAELKKYGDRLVRDQAQLKKLEEELKAKKKALSEKSKAEEAKQTAETDAKLKAAESASVDPLAANVMPEDTNLADPLAA